MREPPVIIGAGPAGCAAAITLAHAGAAPLLLERSAQPGDKVCGDFLSADTMRQAAALGADPAALGAAPIEHVRLVHRRRSIEARLPFAACGLSRRTLDGALLARARDAGARLTTGMTIRTVAPDGAGWQVAASNLSLRSGAVFLATGKHELRGWPRAGRGQGAVGLKMYVRPPAAAARHLEGVTELTLFPGGYAGAQFIEEGAVVLCVAIRPPELQRLGGWDGVLRQLATHNKPLGALLSQAACLLPRALAVAGVPYGFQVKATTPGLFRLGDQAAVIPSLTGDGVSIALHSGASAAEAWLAGMPAPLWQRRTAHALSAQMRLAGAVHMAATHGMGQAALLPMAGWLPGAVTFVAARTRTNLQRHVNTTK